MPCLVPNAGIEEGRMSSNSLGGDLACHVSTRAWRRCVAFFLVVFCANPAELGDDGDDGQVNRCVVVVGLPSEKLRCQRTVLAWPVGKGWGRDYIVLGSSTGIVIKY